MPRTRGPEANRPPEDVVREVEGEVARGFTEVMLLGQTVNAYRHGADDFAALLARVDRVEGLRPLRFTTSHPEHVDERMAGALRDLPRVCPYLHLPFQSGSDRVLASMRRGYTRQEYLDTIALLRDRVPGLALSSDVIVGYPGETETEFEETLGVLEAVGFDSLFASPLAPQNQIAVRAGANPISPTAAPSRIVFIGSNPGHRTFSSERRSPRPHPWNWLPAALKIQRLEIIFPPLHPGGRCYLCGPRILKSCVNNHLYRSSSSQGQNPRLHEFRVHARCSRRLLPR